MSLNIQIDGFACPSELETISFASFPSKSLKHVVINSYLQKFSTLTIAKFTTSTRTNIRLQTSVKILRIFTICSPFNPDCRYNKSISEPIRNVFCSNTVCSSKLCVSN